MILANLLCAPYLRGRGVSLATREALSLPPAVSRQCKQPYLQANISQSNYERGKLSAIAGANYRALESES